MNDRALPTRRRFSLTLERNLAVIFALLGILLTTLIALHWVLVIEPTLRADAESRSRAFAQAQTSGIETLLRNEGRPDELANAIRTELDAVLLLKDESTGTPFVRRITLGACPTCRCQWPPELIHFRPRKLTHPEIRISVSFRFSASVDSFLLRA